MGKTLLLLLFFALVPPNGSPASAAPVDVDVDRAAALAQAWQAIAAGKATDAARLAGSLLRKQPADHDAAAVVIEAHLIRGKAEEALSAYENWLAAAKLEDVFLLRPVARGVLQTLTSSTEPRLRIKSLETLATLGDQNARARLIEISQSESAGNLLADTSLARIGDAGAVRRLEGRLQGPGAGDRSAVIAALNQARAIKSSAMLTLLKDPDPQTRAAAAEALGSSGGADTIPTLRGAQQDPVSLVRLQSTIALARLGDRDGQSAVAELLNSDIPDVRLMAIKAYPPESRALLANAILPILDDQNPLNRIRAAAILAEAGVDNPKIRETLQQALADTNPVVRQEASAASDELPASASLTELRRLLRDPSGWVRLHAASRLLRAD